MRRTKAKPDVLPPVPVVPDPYKKTDMLHAVEGYCPHCGSSESIDVVTPADVGSIDGTAPVGDWCASETLHCNKCGRNFEQLYAMRFDGQQESWRRDLEPASPADAVRDKAERLVRDVEEFIEMLDTLAEQADSPDAVTWCGGYRTEIGMYKDIADDSMLKRVRQRLLELKPYLQ